MKGPLDRTKVVVRNLPPAITQVIFIEQIDGVFAGRYNWVSFRQGKTRLGFSFFFLVYISLNFALNFWVWGKFEFVMIVCEWVFTD